MNNPDFEINLNSSSVENQTGNYEINNQPVEIEINLNAGARGLKGDKGETGATGPTGPQGEKGDKGDTGERGPQGIQGIQGPVGPQGAKGDTGAQGPQGIQGPQGETGETGPQGETGPAGQDGQDGEDGYSPTATVTKSGKVATITITDKDGTTTAEIRDGEDGQGSGDMLKSTYDTDNNGIVDNAEKVNNHTVEADVPSNAVFTDINAVWGNITGTLANQTDLQTAFSNKQDIIDSSNKLSADLVDDTNTTNKFFSGNYNDLSNTPTIPDELADLSDDSTHRVVTDTQISTWGGKQDALVSGTNIKTINSTSLLGSGNIDVGADIPQQDTAPSNPSEDDLWIDTDDPGASITVDSTVSTTSTNPIQNRTITNYVNNMIESGSNYTKFSDGTLICYGTTDNITFTAQNDGRTTINLPVAFKDTNYSVQLSLHSSFPFFTYIHTMTYTRATNSVEVGGFNEHTNSLTGQLDYMIIGRWK